MEGVKIISATPSRIMCICIIKIRPKLSVIKARSLIKGKSALMIFDKAIQNIERGNRQIPGQEDIKCETVR